MGQHDTPSDIFSNIILVQILVVVRAYLHPFLPKFSISTKRAWLAPCSGFKINFRLNSASKNIDFGGCGYALLPVCATSVRLERQEVKYVYQLGFGRLAEFPEINARFVFQSYLKIFLSATENNKKRILAVCRSSTGWRAIPFDFILRHKCGSRTTGKKRCCRHNFVD